MKLQVQKTEDWHKSYMVMMQYQVVVIHKNLRLKMGYCIVSNCNMVVQVEEIRRDEEGNPYAAAFVYSEVYIQDQTQAEVVRLEVMELTGIDIFWFI